MYTIAQCNNSCTMINLQIENIYLKVLLSDGFFIDAEEGIGSLVRVEGVQGGLVVR